MKQNYTEHPFPTFVVGSLPRPQWVRDIVEDRKQGRLTHREADHLLDPAISFAVRLQERAGLDFVSDGEWRRESYVKVFTEAVDGFKLDAFPRAGRPSPPNPAVVEPIRQRRPIALDAAVALHASTNRKSIVALPSPYIMGVRMWRQDLSARAYPTREAFMEACAPLVREEIGRLFAAGIDHVQIDDPELAMLVDPEYRAAQGIKDFDAALGLAVRMINSAVAGHGGKPVSLHVCHAHFARNRATRGGYEPVMEALADIQVQRVAMEFAAPESQGVASLRLFPKDKILGLGVIDHCDRAIETPEQVVRRAEAVFEFVAPERVTLNPDCGFSPGMQNPMDLDEAYGKLKAMCQGAELLREQHR